ncbi:MAG: M20/M25/M40 family metallo-hydrolase [Gemmatimonadetes bacterium]|nr:M20/M25/M40 family metallo-hydrolase [Gemmatimonadota bacterium]
MPHDWSRLIPSDAPSTPKAGAADPRATRILEHESVARARAHLYETDGRTLDEQAALAAVPAPPFGEAERGRFMAELMADSGLDVLSTDGVGNVVAHLPGSGEWAPESGGAQPLVVSAHLDTVFPAGTDTTVSREGEWLRGPGISDDARGLAALLALARALREAGPRVRAPLLFVATVGEEGAGDLRGVRHLFSPEGLLSGGCLGFLSLDGAGLRRIVNAGLGSLRYRATVRGPGGHSWVDYGTPNPIHALTRALDDLTRVPLPRTPATTLSIGRWGGGTSVNAIPTEAWVEFEVRSEAEVELSRMDLEIRSILDRVISPSGRSRRRVLSLDLAILGRRPAGVTSERHPLVQAAVAATSAVGATADLGLSSTDANFPMSLGIPAITIGAGGDAGQAHTPDEWYRNVDGPAGIFRALLTVLLADEALAPRV